MMQQTSQMQVTQQLQQSHQTTALVVTVEEFRLLGIEDAFPNGMFGNGEGIQSIP